MSLTCPLADVSKIALADVGTSESSQHDSGRFIGPWFDTFGNSINVHPVSAFSAHIRATLTKAGRRDIHLTFCRDAATELWLCGDAVMVDGSAAGLRWQFPNSNISAWKRPVSYLVDDARSNISTSVPEVEDRDTDFDLSSVVSSLDDEFDGCKSPSERWFNPIDSNTEFFPLENAMSDIVSCNVGVAFRFDDAESAVSDMTHERLKGRVWQLSQQKYACRDVQQAFEDADKDTCAVLATELCGHVWEAVECCHANHVLQKCIVALASSAAQFIIDEILAWGGPAGALYLATHKFGCRVFERLLEHCSPHQIEPLVHALLAEVESLCQAPYGNFVMQHLLEFATAPQKAHIIDVVMEHAAWMSTEYYASAVVAHCFVHGTPEQKLGLAYSLMQQPMKLREMAVHRFGHQTVIAMLQIPEVSSQVRYCLAETRALLRSSRHGYDVMQYL